MTLTLMAVITSFAAFLVAVLPLCRAQSLCTQPQCVINAFYSADSNANVMLCNEGQVDSFCTDTLMIGNYLIDLPTACGIDVEGFSLSCTLSSCCQNYQAGINWLVTRCQSGLAAITATAGAKLEARQFQCAITTPTAVPTMSPSLPASSAPKSTWDSPSQSTLITTSFGAQVVLPRQLTTIDLGSTTETIICNPAHSYPACQSCIAGTAWGTSAGCTVSTSTPTSSPNTTPTTTPSPTPTSNPDTTPTSTPSTTTSIPPTTTTRTSTPTSRTTTSSTSSQIIVTTSSSETFSFTSVIVPSVSTPTTTRSTGSDTTSTPSSTLVSFPTTPFTGQALLVGTCTIPMYTALVMSGGGIMEAPIIGCVDDRPDCCPSLSTSSNAASTTPPTTSTSTVVVPVYESTAVVAALSADPITVCPEDYTDLGSVCCPSGFTLYSQAIIGQTPCYTVLPSNLPTDAANAAISSISAQIAATASPGSTPTVSVHVITDQVFALSLPHTPHKSHISVATQIGAGVGAGVGGLLVLLLIGWVFWLRKRLRREKEQNRLSADIVSARAGSGLMPIASASLHSSNTSQQPSLPSMGPTPPAGPSPPIDMQMHSQNYFAPYVPPGAQQPYQQTFQQAQPGQPWQQGPYQASGQPMTSIPEAHDEGFHEGYREMPGEQTELYEADANRPRAGVSRMPDGRMYSEPVEMGRSNTPRVLQNLQGLNRRSSDVAVNF